MPREAPAGRIVNVSRFARVEFGSSESASEDVRHPFRVDEPASGEFFGFASMLDQTPHQTSVIALEETVCLEVSRDDIGVLQLAHAFEQATEAWKRRPPIAT